MANYCNYEVRVKGSKKAGLMVFESMPCCDSKEIIREKKSGSSYIISFSGSCKWSVNYGVRDTAPAIDVEAMSEAEIERRSDDYWECSLRAKSEVLQCEIMVHYWSEESGFDQFDHYKNGKLLKQRKIGYDYEEQTEFDWDRLEFVGHEGEYDESVDGEQQDADLMSLLAMLGGGGAPAEEPETDGDDEHIDPDDLLRQLGDLLGQLQDAAAEAGTDPNSSLIGDAGFDMYDWTFTEGTRKKEKGWSVAIPDGFKVIPSKDGRLFEAVPEGTENYGKDDVPISILPGIEIKSDTITGNNWMYHPYARAGVAEIVAVQMAGGLAKLFGTAPEILSAGFSDVCAHVMVQDTSENSYSYQIAVITEGKQQQLRVQTQSITDEQKRRLSRSVLAWVETFRFDKANPSMPKQCKLEAEKVVEDLKAGLTASFEEAVDCAVKEYGAAVAGRLDTMRFHAEHGLLGDDSSDTAREILTRGMEVKEFYYEKADQLIEKLKNEQIKASVMKKVYKKLDEMKDAVTEITVDDEKITVELPAKVQELMKKWKAEAARIAKTEKAEKEASGEDAHKRAVQEAKEYLKNEKNEKARLDKLEKELKAYCDKSSAYFSRFRSEWKSFTRDVSTTSEKMMQDAIRRSVQSSSIGRDIYVNFSLDTDALEKYTGSVIEKVKRKMVEYFRHIAEVDEKLEYFKNNGAVYGMLAKHLRDMIDYVPKFSFEFGTGKQFSIPVPAEISALRDKWKNAPYTAPKKKEAEKSLSTAAMIEVNKIRLQSAEKEYSEAKASYSEVYDELQRESEKAAKLTAEAEQLRKSRSAAKAKLSKARKKLESAEREYEKAADGSIQRQKDLEKEKREKARLAKEERVRVEVFDELADSFKAWAGSKKKRLEQYSVRQKAADDARASLKVILDELDEISGKIAEEETRRQGLKDAFELQKNELDKELEAAKAELDGLEARCARAEAACEAQAKTVKRLRGTLERENETVTEAEKERNKLMGEIERLEAKMSGGK